MHLYGFQNEDKPMTITLNLPEDIARRLAANGEDPARTALEALAIEGYCSRNLSEEQIRRMLGFETRIEWNTTFYISQNSSDG